MQILDKITPTPYTPGYWVTMVFSIALSIAGFVCPPLGHIDLSVLAVIGMVMVYHLAYTAIKAKTPVTLKLDADDHSLSLSTHKADDTPQPDNPASENNA